MNMLSMYLSFDSLIDQAAQGIFYYMALTIFGISVLVFGLKKFVRGPRNHTNATGIIALIFSGLALVLAVILICMAGGGHYKVKCLIFAVKYLPVLITIASASVLAIILAIVYLIMMRDESNRPKWLGACSIQLAVGALLIVGFIYFSALTVSPDEALEYGTYIGNEMLNFWGN